MRVHELIVTHFRGIQALEWRPAPGLTCLIGPGDSTKSTIIDSLSLLLAAGWNTQFTDADFTNGDVSQEVVISATLTDLSDELLANDVFGMSLRGIGPDGTIHDDPLPKCEPAITLELRVDASLEPSWSVLKESDEPRRITGRARELIAAARLDQAVDPHLRWGRATALTRLTGPAPDVPFTLAESHRAARSAVFENPDPALQAAASTAREAAASTGAVRLGPLRPGLDPSVYSRVGSLNLHEGDLPVATYGLGTKRLIALSLQLAATDPALLLIDEVETGLEPHRLNRFLAEIETVSEAGTQVLMATHSPLAMEQLGVAQLAVVRSDACTTTVTYLPSDNPEHNFQGLARSSPTALLSRRVIVGEGATEVGFVEGLLSARGKAENVSAAMEGVSAANGADGGQAAGRALLLRRLGYDVALVVDNDDRSIDARVQAAETAGVLVVRWDEGNCLEKQLFNDVAQSALRDLFKLAVEIRRDEIGDEADPGEGLRNAVSSRLNGSPQLSGEDPSAWAVGPQDLPTVRAALGDAANRGKWFKRQSHGQRLGLLVADLPTEGEVLSQGIDRILKFAFPAN